MSDLNDEFKDSAEQDFKPWEQRPAPGTGSGGGGRRGSSGPEAAPPARLCQEMNVGEIGFVVERQTDLAYYPMVNHHSTPPGDQQQVVGSNAAAWQLFIAEQLYDTRRVTLEHFHLFEWFPLSPGQFHMPQAEEQRHMAYALMERSPDGGSYFNPQGKATMLRGGVGAVRLRPRQIAGEPHYFMTASANGVCHEGFPVLVPRRFYGPLKATMLRQGAAAVTLSGEMRYVYDGLPTFFDSSRQIPQLYLYVDRIADLPGPRPEVEAFTVSAAVSFIGKFEAQEGVYTTYATFDPASPGSLREAVHWMEKFYVAEQYQGVVVTDFDEVQPRFSGVVFGLPDLLAGKLDNEKVAQFLEKYGFDSDAGQPYYVVYQEINTQGGAYIEGDVDTDGGDFIGRDQIINGGE